MHGNFIFPVKTALLISVMVLFSFLPLFLHAQAPSINFDPVISTDLNTPVDVVNAGDNSNRLFIVSQKAATIRVYNSAYNFLGTLVTVSNVRTTGSEEGLLSMAFHPDYETNRLFFVYYTNTSGDLELARYETKATDPNEADPLTKTIILTISHPVENNHNGGKLNFGTDGYLYFATGDGGGGGDPNSNAQNGASLLGKMLRINVDPGQPDPYTIPATNPYTSNASVRDEIWAMGLRNPFRWSFDRANGDMWIGDVGQGSWEEINFRSGPATATGGVNYGWRCFEGTHPYTTCTLGPGTLVNPVFEYPNTNPSAVTGGFVYRGSEYSDLVGTYFATDFYSGTVYLIKNVSGSWVTNTLTGFPDWVAAFGEAENGTLYALSLRGTLYKIQGAVATPVSLISYIGTERNGRCELTWETKNEVDVQQYEVEFSTNGTDFKQAGIVTASKSSRYRFIHTHNQTGNLYYRLRILDMDGKFEYSKIIQIASTFSGSENFVRPTIITNHHLNIDIRLPFNQVQLVNLDGRVVWHQDVHGRTGSLRFALPMLLPGNYVVRLIGNEKFISQKVLVR